MKKSKKHIISYVITTCLLVVGILLFAFNASNIEDNTIFNNAKPKEEAIVDSSTVNNRPEGEMPGGIDISPDINASFAGVRPVLDIAVDGINELSGNYAIIGVLISVLSLVAKLVFYIMELKSNSSSKANLIDNQSKKNGMSIDDKLAELSRLKQKGTISDEEYKNLRAKVLENFCIT